MLIYGRNVVYETLKFNAKSIQKIYFQDGFSDERILSLVKEQGLAYQFKKRVEMDQLARGVHQGIIMDVMDYQYFSLKKILLDDPKFVVILDHLEDPHNFGAIIRTSEAAGVDAIIVPQDREVLVNSTVMKTSAGSLLRMKIAKVPNLSQAIKTLKDSDFWIVGTDMQGEDFKTINYDGKIGLVIGNEGKGISSLIKRECDFMATIPMYGEINSLNASVASGIMIYEVIRNRK